MEAFTHGSVYTEKSLHREAFTPRSFFTTKFLHREASEKPLHRGAFAHKGLHTEAATHRRCFIHMFLVLQQETTLQTETRRQRGLKESWREETRR